MAKSPAFQLYAGDFLTDTAEMTCQQVGIYFRLLCYQWINGSIPAEKSAIADLCRCYKQDSDIDRVIAKFDTGNDGRLRNRRMEVEREKQRIFHECKRLAGKEGSNRRWQTYDSANSKTMAELWPSSSSSSSNKEIPPPPQKNKEVEVAQFFKEFWTEYPRHIAKRAADKAFRRLNLTRKLMDEIITGIRAHKRTKQWQEGTDFIPYPATFLNQHRWEDELPGTVLSKPDGKRVDNLRPTPEGKAVYDQYRSKAS